MNTDRKLHENDDPLDVSMDFTSVVPIFGILMVGLTGAIFICLIEFVVHRMVKSFPDNPALKLMHKSV
jgi:hypothetical protein